MIGNFRNLNLNPMNLRTGDCVVRAIAKATNRTWVETIRDLTDFSIETGLMFNTTEGFERYLLERFNSAPIKTQRHANRRVFKVHEYAEKFNRGTYLIHTRQHLTLVKDGVIYDTWNTSDCVAYKSWKIN